MPFSDSLCLFPDERLHVEDNAAAESTAATGRTEQRDERRRPSPTAPDGHLPRYGRGRRRSARNVTGGEGKGAHTETQSELRQGPGHKEDQIPDETRRRSQRVLAATLRAIALPLPVPPKG